MGLAAFGAAGAGVCSGAATLPDGETIYVGAQDFQDYPPYASFWSSQVVRYDPLHEIQRPVSSLPVPMAADRSVLLLGDKVLVVAGTDGSGLLPTSRLYDPTLDRWSVLTTWPGSFVEDSAVLTDGSAMAVDDSGLVYRLLPPGGSPTLTRSTYVPLGPVRLLDTRSANGLAGPFVARVPRTFQVAGRGGVALNAIAVTGDLTATAQTKGGYVSLTPAPTTSPSTSTLNFPAGDTRGSGVTSRLGPGGTLSATFIGAPGARTALIFDVTGYFVPDASGATYVPVGPVRLLDTRFAYGFPAVAVHSRSPMTFQIAGPMVPLDAIAVTGDLTVTAPTKSGYVSLTPAPTTSPSTSTLNFPAGDTRGTGVTSRLGADGTLSATFISAPGYAALIFDVTGYFVP